MLRRAFMRALGAVGIGGSCLAMRTTPIAVVTDTGHRIGTVELKEAVDMGVFSIRVGDKVSIEVRDGGVLKTGDNLTVNEITVHPGGNVNGML